MFGKYGKHAASEGWRRARARASASGWGRTEVRVWNGAGTRGRGRRWRRRLVCGERGGCRCRGRGGEEGIVGFTERNGACARVRMCLAVFVVMPSCACVLASDADTDVDRHRRRHGIIRVLQGSRVVCAGVPAQRFTGNEPVRWRRHNPRIQLCRGEWRIDTVLGQCPRVVERGVLAARRRGIRVSVRREVRETRHDVGRVEQWCVDGRVS